MRQMHFTLRIARLLIVNFPFHINDHSISISEFAQTFPTSHGNRWHFYQLNTGWARSRLPIVTLNFDDLDL